MDTRISYIADRLRTSYWFIPALMLLVAAVLAWATVNVDENYDPEKLPWLGELVYSGGADGAHALLGAIATSMITVAGVVFSIAIVTLQLASSQFGPRMLATFVRDRGNQLTLGTFVSSFLYSLLVMRAVRTDPETVPHLSVAVALALAVAGLSVLIYFIHHVSSSIQAPNLVDAIARELRRSIDALFPDADQAEGARSPAPAREPGLPGGFESTARPIEAPASGYVQVIDLETLVEVAHEHDLVIRLETRPGRFVVDNTRFALAHPASRVTDEVAEALAATVVTGARRTAQQDIEFPIRQLVEIAVRALSPGINDPFTASTCVDQVGAGLCELARRELPSPFVMGEDGALRVVAGDPVTWERLVGSAFDQIRQCADFHVPVYVHLLESLTRIAGCVRDPDRLQALGAEAELVMAAVEANVPAEADRAAVRMRYDDLAGVVGERR